MDLPKNTLVDEAFELAQDLMVRLVRKAYRL
jgi:hypothetical protein